MPASSRSARGSAWVVGQFVLMAAVLVLGVLKPIWPDPVRMLGISLVVAGIVLAVWAGRSLGGSLTPYPVPREGAALVERGPYRLVRHPMYLAGVLVFLGYGFLASIPATAAVVLLGLLWHFKARVEERHLEERFAAYGDYRRRVRAGI
jgi:protein-S-isoprenylcysteine O-methyltransferase Ste14